MKLEDIIITYILFSNILKLLWIYLDSIWILIKKSNRSVAGACLTFIKARLIFYKENKKDKYYEQRIL